MNKHEDEKLNVKRNKWRKMWPFWVAIWILFNPISILVLSVGLLTHQAETVTQRNNKINERFKEFCDGDEYAFFDRTVSFSFSNHKIGFYESHSLPYSAKFDNDDKKYYLEDFLIYTESNYYFLFSYEAKNSFVYLIARTDLFFRNFEIITTIGETTQLNPQNPYWRSGLDSVGYFELNDAYYSYNFETFSLQEINQNSAEASYLKMKKGDFYKSYGVTLDKCRQKDGVYCFSCDNNEYQFDCKIIDENVLSLMKEYNYKPSYHQSYSSGETSILCYSDLSFSNDLLGHAPNCLIINYNRTTNSVISYQVFANIYFSEYCFLHKIILN